jgi:hypothetical protein
MTKPRAVPVTPKTPDKVEATAPAEGTAANQVAPTPPGDGSISSRTAPPALKIQSFQAWPKSVPAGDKALAHLQGAGDDAELTSITQTFRATLSPVELQVLEPSIPDSDPLRSAMLIRWRLAVALERKPALGAPFDSSALEKLLQEVDLVLEKLPPNEGAEQSLQAALSSARGALARDAIALSEFARLSREQAVKDARALGRAAAPQAVRRVTVDEDSETQGPRRNVKLIVVTVVLALCSGFFHAMQWRNAPKVSAVSAPSGTPQDAMGAGQGGIVLFKPIDPSKFNAAEYRTKLEAKGQQLKELGNGHYLIMPAETGRSSSPAR